MPDYLNPSAETQQVMADTRAQCEREFENRCLECEDVCPLKRGDDDECDELDVKRAVDGLRVEVERLEKLSQTLEADRNRMLAERDTHLNARVEAEQCLAGEQARTHDAKTEGDEAKAERDAERAKLVLIRSKWQSYEKYLRAKYPAPEGEEWTWTCEFHKAIADALREA